jgi:hypothetical protein
MATSLSMMAEPPKPEPGATETALRSLALNLDPKALRADLLREKDYGFRDTQTYARVTDAFTRQTGKPAPYAMLPQISLSSPKIRHTMTTAMFARAVMARYARCMKAK